MRNMIAGLCGVLMLAGCGGKAEQPKAAAKKAASLQPGEYEVSITVDALRSTDKTTPKSPNKVGDPVRTARTCVPADSALDYKLFAEAGETCEPMDLYMRGGRINLQYKCRRGGDQLTQMADGDFTADSFDAKVMTATYFAGDGDYELTRTFTGKRVGDCPAAGAEAAAQ